MTTIPVATATTTTTGWNRTKFAREIRPELDGKYVRLGGFVQSVRTHGKNLGFIILRDSTGDVQLTLVRNEVDAKLFELMTKLTPESVIGVEGKVRATTQTPRGVEVIPSNIQLLAQASTPLPLDPTGRVHAELSTRLNWRSIDLRKPYNNAIFRIQSGLVEGVIQLLKEEGFILVFTPCLIGAASESGAELFEVPYLGDKITYLRQDPQLHRQLTIAAGFDKIVDIGPSWRADPSHTTRHLCEHRGIAVELAFINDETDLMRLQEAIIVAGFKYIRENYEAELELLDVEIEIPRTPFPELRYPELYTILEELGKPLEFGKAHDFESEQLLAEYVADKYQHEFFFINRFPFESKPFYVMRVDSDPQWARSIDLIYRGIELSSGGQREHRYDKLIANIREKGLHGLDWFTSVFKYGVPPHGGFNIGIERLTMQLLNLKNIREAVLFPRDPDRILP